MRINYNQNFVKLIRGFSAVGLFTTLVSLAFIFIFLKLLHTPLIATYIAIYGATIALSFVLNSLFVFKSGLTFENGFKYAVVYLSGMLVGTLLLWVLKKTLPFENYLLGYLVLPFTMVWNFALSYLILKPIKPC